jgi:hypothetical protein
MIPTITTPNNAEDADMSAAKRSAADHGAANESQPIVANRWLTELQARDQHDSASAAKAGNRVR